MHKVFDRFLITTASLLLFFFLIPSTVSAEELSPIDGTFFPAHLAVDFSEEQWDNEMAEWDEMGIKYVIIGESALRTADGKWQTFYPSQYSDIYYHNSVETILQHCEQADVKCFVACGGYENFDTINLCRHDEYDTDGNVTVRGQETFLQLVNDTHRYMQELYDLYAEKYPNSFYGFYFVPEVSNSVEFEQAELMTIGIDSLSKALNLTINKINQLNPKMKLLLSPYVNLKTEATWNTHDVKTIERFWTGVIQKTNFREGDILSPQDSVGANGVKITQLERVTKAYRNAVDTAGKPISLWSNCETFLFPINELDVPYETGQSAYIKRLIQQTSIVKPYVDQIISCSYTNYLGQSNCGSSFYRTYRDYLRTGQLDRTPPLPVNHVKGDVILIDKKPVLRLTCDPVSDQYGVARMEVTKNHKPFTFRVATRYEKHPTDLKPGIKAPDTFYDEDFSLENGSCVYGITLYDCAGNQGKEVLVSVSSGLLVEREIKDPCSEEYYQLHHREYEIHCTVNEPISDLF